MQTLTQPAYMFCEAARGGSPALLWQHYAKHQPLPPDEVKVSTHSGPHALCLYLAGPIQEEPPAMPTESLAILTGRLTNLLHENPEGLTARDISLRLGAERPFSDTALQALVSTGRAVAAMKEIETTNGYHAVTIYRITATQ